MSTDCVKEKLRNLKFRAWGPEPFQCQLNLNDLNWLRDTVKQQNQEVKELTHFLKVANELVDYKNKQIEKISKDNQRLQNLVQSLTEKNQSLGERDADAANH